MRFHVTISVLDSVVLDGDKAFRARFGPQMQKVITSGKVETAGLLAGKRGGFFVVNIDDPAELYELFGPEVYGNCHVEAHAIVPPETGGEIFARWSAEGR